MPLNSDQYTATNAFEDNYEVDREVIRVNHIEYLGRDSYGARMWQGQDGKLYNAWGLRRKSTDDSIDNNPEDGDNKGKGKNEDIQYKYKNNNILNISEVTQPLSPIIYFPQSANPSYNPPSNALPVNNNSKRYPLGHLLSTINITDVSNVTNLLMNALQQIPTNDSNYSNDKEQEKECRENIWL